MTTRLFSFRRLWFSEKRHDVAPYIAKAVGSFEE